MSVRMIRADKCQVSDIYGTVKEYTDPQGDQHSLELRLVRWGTGQPVYDLRWWKESGDPEYGLTFGLRDLAELGELIDCVFDAKG